MHRFIREDESTPKWISVSIALLAMLRQFVFLPVMAGTIPKLVFWNGSTAVDICFNAVSASQSDPLEFLA